MNQGNPQDKSDSIRREIDNIRKTYDKQVAFCSNKWLEVDILQRTVEVLKISIKKDQEMIEQKLDVINDKIDVHGKKIDQVWETRSRFSGGWFVLVIIGGILLGLSSIISTIASFLD